MVTGTKRGLQRRGAGTLLWVALGLLAALAVMTLYQRFFASHVTETVERTMASELAQHLGHSVLEEAIHAVRTRVNDPVQDLFYDLRRPVTRPDPGYLAVPLKDVGAEADALVSSGALAQFSFSRARCEVVYQRQFDDLPDERFGLLHLWTRTTGAVGAGEAVTREVHAYHQFKTVLVTPPRPFDELPFYFGRAGSLTDLAEVNRSRQQIVDFYRKIWEALTAAARMAPAGVAGDYRALLDGMDPPEKVAESAPMVPEDPSAHVAAIWITGQEFAMESLDLARRLQGALPEVRQVAGDVERLAALLPAQSTSEAAHRQFMDRAQQASSLILKQVLRIWGYARAFQFIEPAAPEYATYEARARARLSFEYFRRKAFFVLKEKQGEPIQAQWERLVHRICGTRADPLDLNGIVVVENDVEPLTIRGALHGKLIVVTGRGGLSLTDVNSAATPDESLVAACFGGQIRISGVVKAVVIAGPGLSGEREIAPRINMAHGSRIHGGLLVGTTLGPSDLAGILTYDDKFYGGPVNAGAVWPSHYYVGIAPRTAFRDVIRK